MVHAVVVAFHPEVDRFVAALRATARQVDAVVVVDNGGAASRVGEFLRDHRHESDCTLLPMQGNVGVAAAQNAGIEHVLSAGAD